MLPAVIDLRDEAGRGVEHLMVLLPFNDELLRQGLAKGDEPTLIYPAAVSL